MTKKAENSLLIRIPAMTMMILSTIGFLILALITHIEGLSPALFYGAITLIFLYASVIAIMVRTGFKILLEEIEGRHGT